MKKPLILTFVLLATAALALADNKARFPKKPMGNHGLPVILSFDTMYGVEGALLGETNPIRGVVGDEAPWSIAHFIKGRLFKNGRLQILVRGLVFSDDPLLTPTSSARTTRQPSVGSSAAFPRTPVAAS